MASKAQFDKIQGLIQKGIDEGATVVVGGPGRPDGLDTGYYVKPTVFANVTNDMTIAREEIFGPVLCILGYDDLDQALEIANDTDYGLAGYVSAADLDKARAVARRIRAGSVAINHAFDMNAPFGGYKRSGNGREWGEFGSTSTWRSRARWATRRSSDFGAPTDAERMLARRNRNTLRQCPAKSTNTESISIASRRSTSTPTSRSTATATRPTTTNWSTPSGKYFKMGPGALSSVDAAGRRVPAAQHRRRGVHHRRADGTAARAELGRGPDRRARCATTTC